MKLFLGILATIFFLAVTSSILQFIAYHNEQHNCAQIELIKGRVRHNAVDSYVHLDQTLKLIGLKDTPALRASAKKTELKTLRDYSADRCAGVFG